VANQEDTDGNPRPPQIHKPPPIFIHGVIKYGEMIKRIRDIAEDENIAQKAWQIMSSN
jgi:hypothetical protein